MSDPIRVRSASRGPARALVSVCVLACFGLLPLSQALHVVFADHLHRYCAEHDRFEDVPDSPPPAGLPDGAPSFRSPDTSTHAPCAVLNAHVPRRLLVASTLSADVGLALAATQKRPIAQTPRAASGLILLAPKNSPPNPTV